MVRVSRLLDHAGVIALLLQTAVLRDLRAPERVVLDALVVVNDLVRLLHELLVLSALLGRLLEARRLLVLVEVAGSREALRRLVEALLWRVRLREDLDALL